MASGIVAKQFTMVVNEVLPGVQVPAIYPQRQRQQVDLVLSAEANCQRGKVDQLSMEGANIQTDV